MRQRRECPASQTSLRSLCKADCYGHDEHRDALRASQQTFSSIRHAADAFRPHAFPKDNKPLVSSHKQAQPDVAGAIEAARPARATKIMNS
jgi:hypothetical protein